MGRLFLSELSEGGGLLSQEPEGSLEEGSGDRHFFP